VKARCQHTARDFVHDTLTIMPEKASVDNLLSLDNFNDRSTVERSCLTVNFYL